MDNLSKDKRSWNMGRITGKDTKPELTVRRMLYGLGYRFRLHRKDLPGRPDIVLTKYRTVIQVHGCFWHQHEGCADGSRPKTNTSFWHVKLKGNVERDDRNTRLLEGLGWNVEVIWECETARLENLLKRINNVLENHRDAQDVCRRMICN